MDPPAPAATTISSRTFLTTRSGSSGLWTSGGGGGRGAEAGRSGGVATSGLRAVRHEDAANIMAIYNQYRWRFRRLLQPKNKRWKGLQDTDTWQQGYLKPGSPALREIDFWVGA